MTEQEWRQKLGRALAAAREGSVRDAVAASGVWQGAVTDLERGTKERVSLSSIYLLAKTYRVGLGDLLIGRVRASSWPAGGPTLSDVEVHVRVAARQHRESRGWTQKELEVRAGISGKRRNPGDPRSAAQVSRLESGTSGLSLARAWLLARAMGLTFDDLLPEPMRSTKRRRKT